MMWLIVQEKSNARYVTGAFKLSRSLGLSDVQSDWYSGGHGFNPRSGHISFVEIRS